MNSSSSKPSFSSLPHHVWVRFGLWIPNKRKGMGIGVCLLPLFFLNGSEPPFRGVTQGACSWVWFPRHMGNLAADTHVVAIVLWFREVFSIFKSHLGIYRYSLILPPLYLSNRQVPNTFIFSYVRVLVATKLRCDFKLWIIMSGFYLAVLYWGLFDFS